MLASKLTRYVRGNYVWIVCVKVKFSKNTSELVEEIILIQEYSPGSHSAPAEIARNLNMDRRPVSHIIDQGLDLGPLMKRKVQKLTDSNTEKSMIR